MQRPRPVSGSLSRPGTAGRVELALPKSLPGNNFDDLVNPRASYHKAHVFDYYKGYPVVGSVPVPEERVDVDEVAKRLEQAASLVRTAPVRPGTVAPKLDIPSFAKTADELIHPRKVAAKYSNTMNTKGLVLRFNGFFREPVHESAIESFRLRRVDIMYYMEDGTIHVSEVYPKNSGFLETAFLRRQPVPNPARAGQAKNNYTQSDLNVGIDIDIYGRIMHINACDGFTREFLQSAGVQVAADEELPEDPFVALQQAAEEQRNRGPSAEDKELKNYNEYTAAKGKAAKLSVEQVAAAQQFLRANPTDVLVFRGVWDDSASIHGEIHWLTINYFLANDTFEINEDYQQGRDPWPVFLKRQKLFKEAGHVSLESLSRSSAPPSAVAGDAARATYSHADLRVGASIQIFGRSVLIVEANNEFTREFLRSQGVSDAELAPIKVDVPRSDLEVAIARAKEAPLPAWNGYGSPEDSLQNCKLLVLKPPKKDVKKWMALDHEVLRYSATLNSSSPTDKGREFIISYYPATDEIMIMEPPRRNSGVMGGKFLAKRRIPRHNGSSPTDYLEISDLVIGSDLRILSHSFKITGADEHTKKALESLGL